MKVPNRAREYRNRAEECRIKATTVEDEAGRRALLETAEIWERMANYEEKNFPARST
jgi:hypothetical protein